MPTEDRAATWLHCWSVPHSPDEARERVMRLEPSRESGWARSRVRSGRSDAFLAERVVVRSCVRGEPPPNQMTTTAMTISSREAREKLHSGDRHRRRHRGSCRPAAGL